MIGKTLCKDGLLYWKHYSRKYNEYLYACFLEKYKMEISVIVPVYNTEKYLERCLQSIIDQKGLEKEIILVNDGSTDASAGICDEYAHRYSCVKSIHITNSGPATAKNVGFRQATGDYVAFIDSDDKVGDDMFSKMISLAYRHNADIVCCNYIQIDEEGNISHTKCSHKDYVLDTEEGLKHLLLKDKIYSQCWTKIYRRRMLTEYKVVNVDGLRTDEDFIYNLNAFGHSKIVCIIDEPLYVYTHRKNSLSKDYFRKHISQFMDNMQLRLQMVDRVVKDEFPNLTEYSTYHCLMYYNELIGKVALFPQYYTDQRVKKIFAYMRSNIDVLNKYHARCGFSKKGVLLLRFMPSWLYLYYRRCQARK